MVTQVDSQHERVLTWIRPIADGGQCLGRHHLDQFGQQCLGVACHAHLDALVLNECILYGVVQGILVLAVATHIKVGVEAMQNLMHTEPSPLDQVSVSHHSIIAHVGNVDAVIAVNASSGDLA